MNIIITGGAGFIGSHLTKRLLQEGHSVTIIDNLLTGSLDNLKGCLHNPALTFVKKDVVALSPDDDVVAFDHIDQIYHLASPASPNHHASVSYHALPMETMLVNTIGTLTMLKLAEKYNARFLFASTSEVYGDPLVNPQPETYLGNVSTTGPRSVYDEAKRFGETLTAYFTRERQVDGRIIRIFNTYGPHLSPADMRMIVNFATQALRGEPITVYGDGSQTRSLCYIDDTIEGMVRLMNYDNTKGEIVNIGSSEEHTVLEFAQMVQTLTGSQSPIEHTEHLPTDDPHKRQPDTRKARELLGWSAHTQLTDGLRHTIEYVRSVIMHDQSKTN